MLLKVAPENTFQNVLFLLVVCFLFVFYIFTASCLSLGICLFEHFITGRLPLWQGRRQLAQVYISASHRLWVMRTLSSGTRSALWLFKELCWDQWRTGEGEGKRALRKAHASEGDGPLQGLTVTRFVQTCDSSWPRK